MQAVLQAPAPDNIPKFFRELPNAYHASDHFPLFASFAVARLPPPAGPHPAQAGPAPRKRSKAPRERSRLLGKRV